MVKRVTHSITSHDIVLMPQTPARPEMFGWIRLMEGPLDAGYIYLTSDPKEPRLGSENDYIVTSIPFDQLGTMLTILKTTPDLVIEYHDPEVPGISPTVFIASRQTVGGAVDVGNAEVL